MGEAERMEKVLLELRMDAEALGKSIGRPDGDTIRNVLKGRNGISAKLAQAIHEKHKISFTWLRTGNGEMRESPKAKESVSAYDCNLCNEKERMIKLLETVVEGQNQTIKIHEKCIDELCRREPVGDYQDSG